MEEQAADRSRPVPIGKYTPTPALYGGSEGRLRLRGGPLPARPTASPYGGAMHPVSTPLSGRNAVPDCFDYVGDVYRPPGEAHNILIQATVGCSHGACTFCSGHAGKRFRIKDRAVLEGDLAFAERYCARQDRVFVIDGNALTMPTEQWRWLLESIRARLPWVTGVGSFATAMDVAAKSGEELARLRGLGLDRIYMGVESGLASVLRRIRKGVDPDGLLRQGRRVKQAGMELQVSLIVGMVNADESMAHAKATGELLSAMDPDVVTVLSLLPEPGTRMREELDRGELVPPDTPGILWELRELLRHTNLDGGLFDNSHSTNYLSFQCRLPGEKQAGLDCIDAALAGAGKIIDNAMRHM